MSFAGSSPAGQDAAAFQEAFEDGDELFETHLQRP